jgi:hypothetical protein
MLMKSKESLSSDIKNASLLQYIINIRGGITGSTISSLNSDGLFLHSIIIASNMYTADASLLLYCVMGQPNLAYLQIYITSHRRYSRVGKAAGIISICFKVLLQAITIEYVISGFLSNKTAAEVLIKNCSSNDAPGFR